MAKFNNMSVIPKEIGEIAFGELSRQTIKYDQDGLLIESLIRLQFTLTNGGSAAVAPQFEALAALIQDVDIKIGGSDVVIKVDGPGLVAYARNYYNTAPDGVDDTVVLTGSAVTTYDIMIPIPHFLPMSSQPLYTGIATDRLPRTRLAITWGNADSIYGTANAAAISNVTCTLYGRYLENYPDGMPAMRVLDVIEKNLAATSSKYSVLIDEQTGIPVRSLMIVGLVDGVADESIFDAGTQTIKAGSKTYQGPMPSKVIQGLNKNTFGLAAHQVGVYHHASEVFANGGMWIDTRRSVMAADLHWQAAVVKQAGTNTIRIYRELVRSVNL